MVSAEQQDTEVPTGLRLRRAPPLNVGAAAAAAAAVPAEEAPHTLPDIALAAVPVVHPTADEFANPQRLLSSLAQRYAASSGIVKIVPPQSWSFPFALDSTHFWFRPRLQEINIIDGRSRSEMAYFDQLRMFHSQEGRAFTKVPLLDRRPIKLRTLRDLVSEGGGHVAISESKHWASVARNLGIHNFKTCTSMSHACKQVYLRWIHPYEHWINANRRGARAGNANGVQPSVELQAANASSSSTELYEPDSYVPTSESVSEQSSNAGDLGGQIKGRKVIRKVPGDKSDCQLCFKSGNEERMIVCDKCNLGYHFDCLQPAIKTVPESEWFCAECLLSHNMADYGFRNGDVRSLESFRLAADEFKQTYFRRKYNRPYEELDITDEQVEMEYLSILESPFDDIEVEYGADLHSNVYGSGFPTVETMPGERSATDPWNLNNIGISPDYLLSLIDKDISGVTNPWLYVGMLFSTFCWHAEDHNLYSINYHHMGAKKTWYAIPGNQASEFESFVLKTFPDITPHNDQFLFDITMMLNPYVLARSGIDISAVEQGPGEFIVTFPSAYHAGFNHGFNICEAVNFAPPDWVKFGSLCIDKYFLYRKSPLFSHEMLLYKAAEKFGHRKEYMDHILPLISRIIIRQEAIKEELEKRFVGIRMGNRTDFDLSSETMFCSECEKWCGFRYIHDPQSQFSACSLHAPALLSWILEGPNLDAESVIKSRLFLIYDEDGLQKMLKVHQKGVEPFNIESPLDVVSIDQLTPTSFILPSGDKAPVATMNTFTLNPRVIRPIGTRFTGSMRTMRMIKNESMDNVSVKQSSVGQSRPASAEEVKEVKPRRTARVTRSTNSKRSGAAEDSVIRTSSRIAAKESVNNGISATASESTGGRSRLNSDASAGHGRSKRKVSEVYKPTPGEKSLSVVNASESQFIGEPSEYESLYMAYANVADGNCDMEVVREFLRQHPIRSDPYYVELSDIVHDMGLISNAVLNYQIEHKFSSMTMPGFYSNPSKMTSTFVEEAMNRCKRHSIAVPHKNIIRKTLDEGTRIVSDMLTMEITPIHERDSLVLERLVSSILKYPFAIPQSKQFLSTIAKDIWINSQVYKMGKVLVSYEELEEIIEVWRNIDVESKTYKDLCDLQRASSSWNSRAISMLSCPEAHLRKVKIHIDSSQDVAPSTHVIRALKDTYYFSNKSRNDIVDFVVSASQIGAQISEVAFSRLLEHGKRTIFSHPLIQCYMNQAEMNLMQLNNLLFVVEEQFKNYYFKLVHDYYNSQPSLMERCNGVVAEVKDAFSSRSGIFSTLLNQVSHIMTHLQNDFYCICRAANTYGRIFTCKVCEISFHYHCVAQFSPPDLVGCPICMPITFVQYPDRVLPETLCDIISFMNERGFRWEVYGPLMLIQDELMKLLNVDLWVIANQGDIQLLYRFLQVCFGLPILCRRPILLAKSIIKDIMMGVRRTYPPETFYNFAIDTDHDRMVGCNECLNSIERKSAILLPNARTHHVFLCRKCFDTVLIQRDKIVAVNPCYYS